MLSFPLITVIIPSYNSPDIFRPLQSVVMQDYPRIQLILVDDDSVSFPMEDVEHYLTEHNRGNLEQIQILVNPENKGTVFTMNRALSVSQGEYIFNLASDDCFQDARVLSDWVSEFVKTGAQVITAYRAIYDEQMQTRLQVAPTPQEVKQIRTQNPRELFEEIAKRNTIFGSCTARTAACVRKYGFYDERYRLVEDHSMNLKLLRLGEKIHFFDRVVVKCRSGGTSSPEQYNAMYAQDVDNILKYEVLPYTRHPLQMRWRCFQWKRDQRLLQKRAKALSQHRGRSLMCFLIDVRYYLHFPLRTFLRIPRRIAKMIKKENQHSGTDKGTFSDIY